MAHYHIEIDGHNAGLTMFPNVPSTQKKPKRISLNQKGTVNLVLIPELNSKELPGEFALPLLRFFTIPFPMTGNAVLSHKARPRRLVLDMYPPLFTSSRYFNERPT